MMITPLQLGRVIQDGYEGLPVNLEGYSCTDLVLMRPRFLFWRESIVTGFLFESNDDSTPVIVFMGTKDAIEWANNLDSDSRSYSFADGIPSKVEHGFLRMFRRCRLRIRKCTLEEFISHVPGRLVTFAGHSLGGALALVCARISIANGIKTRVVTFGHPKTGDLAFVTAVSNGLLSSSVILRNIHDIVPQVPPWLADLSYPISTFDSDSLQVAKDVASRHKMPCYLLAAANIS